MLLASCEGLIVGHSHNIVSFMRKYYTPHDNVTLIRKHVSNIRMLLLSSCEILSSNVYMIMFNKIY